MPSSSQQQALREAVAAAINSADGGPPCADDWSRQAADAAIGVVLTSVQAAIEQQAAPPDVRLSDFGRGYERGLVDALAVVDALRTATPAEPAVRTWPDPGKHGSRDWPLSDRGGDA